MFLIRSLILHLKFIPQEKKNISIIGLCSFNRYAVIREIDLSVRVCECVFSLAASIANISIAVNRIYCVQG